VLQGAAGVAGLSLLRDGVPRYAPFLLADHLVGEIAAGLVSAALFSRASTHSGTSLEVPMMETLSAFVLKEHLGPSSFHPPLGRAGDVRVLDPENSPLQTSDGFISVTSNSDKQVAGFLRAVGHPELIHEPRFSTVVARFNNARDWFQFRSQTLKTNTTAYWLKAFAAADVPAMPCNTLESLQEDPQIKAAGLLVKKIHPSEGLVTVIQSSILIDGERAEDDSHSPGIGSDTRAVLVGTGMVEEEIDALAADGDIFCSQGANPPKMVAQ
jgi:crotonobetainyl-CoA:carnitine CoA-transferase CaiB-like acyl-CoA transferase